MTMGPIFRFELLTTARQGRFHVLRVVYGLFLLVVLWQNFAWWMGAAGGELTSRQIRWFALTTFGSIAALQELLVLILTPALVAGVVADERQRKTLHYLMASRLTAPEIVLGKLGVRLVHLLACLAVGLPIQAMLIWFGAVDPRLILLMAGLTLSTAWLLATMAVAMSTASLRVRDAVFAAYAIEAAWLVLPRLLEAAGAAWIPTGLAWVDGPVEAGFYVSGWIYESSPTSMFTFANAMSAITGGPAALAAAIGRRAAIQAVAGLGFAAFAVWRLRPAFRDLEGGRRRRLFGRRGPAVVRDRPRRRLVPKPAMGDRPLLWKELHTGRRGGAAKRITAACLALIALGVGVQAAWLAWPAFVEMLEQGWAYTHPTASTQYQFNPWSYTYFRARLEFGLFLQFLAPVGFALWMAVVAAAAAGGATSEHEGDTWTSLTGTLIEAREFVLAKQIGAIWASRWIGLGMALLWASGLAVGSIHPGSLVVWAIAVPLGLWFAAALGLVFSLQFRATYRALVLTIGALMACSVAGQAMLGLFSNFPPFLWPGSIPALVGWGTFVPHDLAHVGAGPYSLRERLRFMDIGFEWHVIWACVTIPAVAGSAAWLSRLSARSYDRVAGRAVRPSTPHPLAGAGPAEGPGEAIEAVEAAGAGASR